MQKTELEDYNFLSINEYQAITAERALVLWKLDKLYFPTPWSLTDWSSLYQNSHLLVILLSKEVVVGFCLFSMSAADSFAHLLKILIIPDYQMKGLSKKLLEKTLIDLQLLGYNQFFLEVEEGNSAAHKLYLSLDFKIIHKKKDFYGAGRAALIMLKSSLI